MNACAWCGARTRIVHTRIDTDALPGQQPILLCLDRPACVRRMREQTEQQLSTGEPR